MMLSNAGVIPRKFEDKYPFESYDWNEKQETPEIKKRYIQVTCERIKRYLSAHRDRFNQAYCYLKYESESYKALQEACRMLDFGLRNLLEAKTCRENPGLRLYDTEALNDLEGNARLLAENSM